MREDDGSIFDEMIKPRLRWDPKGPIPQMFLKHVTDHILAPYYQEVRANDRDAIKFGFIDDINFNAFAIFPNTIAVNLGSLAILLAIYRYMLATPQILPSIGDSSKEVEPPPVSWLGFVDAAIMPKDPTRRAYSLYLASMAFDFLVRHELAHLRNGHVDFLNAEAGIQQILEINTQDSGINLLDFQTMEMDADCYAARNGFQWFISREAELYTDTQTLVAGGPNRQTAYLWLFAIHGFFLAFYEAAVAASEIQARTHPPTNMRQVIINATILEIITGPLAEMFREVVGPAVGDSSRAFAQLHGKNVDPTYALTAINEEYQAHSQRILSNWNSLRPRLLPFARGPLVGG